MIYTPPDYECDRCPRLRNFICENRRKFPDKFNGPVPSFGGLEARFLVVGLAPGLQGANFTGRPFTDDYAGDLLYPTLLKFGFAKGTYGARADDGLELVNCRITNAVRCVPPQNKPEGSEINTCNTFLQDEIAAMKNLKIILSLGLVSHNAVLKALGLRAAAYKFAHGAVHDIPLSSFRPNPRLDRGEAEESHTVNRSLCFARDDKLILIDSYHCSRYNTNTKRLTTEMFEGVFSNIHALMKDH